jgi:hypothetical protein
LAPTLGNDHEQLRQQKKHFDKKQLASFSKWATQRPNAADEAAKISQQRRDLWDALHDLIRKDGGAIVSVRYASPIRIEVATDSELPARLHQLGYDLMFREQATRIGAAPVEHDRRGRPRTSSGYGFSVCDVYELKL